MPPRNQPFSVQTAPEVFFTSAEISQAVRRLVGRGEARKVGPRLYTTNLAEDLPPIVRRNLWQIAAGYVPAGVVADRTALEHQPTDDGSIFIVGAGKEYRSIELPGLTIRVRPGPGPMPGDMPFIGGLHLSSEARALLENLRPSRRRSGPPRTLSREAIERRLAEVAARRGDAGLNEIRDQARSLAKPLGAEREFARLDELIGGLLGTQPTTLATAPGLAWQAGRPFDPARLELFDLLFAELKRHVPEDRPERPEHSGATFAFYEAYFSNFIEGTEFLVEEAKAIVFEGRIPTARPEDAHDILGTFELVNGEQRKRRVPSDVEGYLELLKENHALMLSRRPEVRPGRLKERPNQAGGVRFVEPRLVQGTLAAGFERYQALEPGFPRAVFQMFLVAEVHPFDDGNGRIGRAIMNAELSAAAQERLMVTTSIRDSYIGALRALSYNKNPGALVRVLDRIQGFSAAGDWSSDEAATRTLTTANAFQDPLFAQPRGVV